MTRKRGKQWSLLLLVLLLTPVLGKFEVEQHGDNDEESVIDLQDLLINVQSSLKEFKLDRDEIKQSVSTRIDELEKNVSSGRDKLEKSVAVRLDKFEESIEEKLSQCGRENVSAVLASFREHVSSRLDKIEIQLSKLGETTAALPKLRHCADVYDHQSQISGVYTVQPPNSEPFQVYCDMTTDGGGWTVFQKRGFFPGIPEDNFFRGWQEYKDGFGDFDTEFWMGLSKISLMTRAGNGYQELRVDLVDFENSQTYAKYEDFVVEDEKKDFTLIIGKYDGNAGDSLSYHNQQKFSTYDRDNDAHSAQNCAAEEYGAWWFRSCFTSSLNALNKWKFGIKVISGHDIFWKDERGRPHNFSETEMKFRPMGWTGKKS